MSEPRSIRTRIVKAIAYLVDQGQPLTRRAIAEIAGCSLRTVSYHKDLWKHLIESAEEKESLTLWAKEFFLLSERLDLLSEKLKTINDVDDLRSFEAALRWYLLILSDEAQSDSDHLRKRVRSLLAECEKQTRQFGGSA